MKYHYSGVKVGGLDDYFSKMQSKTVTLGSSGEPKILTIVLALIKISNCIIAITTLTKRKM